ncbi:hypothetical protein FGB62_3g225 [Gracilaria domingensis]|nr:hypothetical protein FGB62_3g225 [Gracilaria domingensis]
MFLGTLFVRHFETIRSVCPADYAIERAIAVPITFDPTTQSYSALPKQIKDKDELYARSQLASLTTILNTNDIQQIPMISTKVTLAFVLFAAALASGAVVHQVTPPGKCWQRTQQCCYKITECGWRCREGAGFKHCWKKYCNVPVCSEIKARTAVPTKPEDEVEWEAAVITDCTEKPEECGSHPPGVDYEVEDQVEEELPMPSGEEEMPEM